METRRGKEKFRNFQIILYSGISSKISMNKGNIVSSNRPPVDQYALNANTL